MLKFTYKLYDEFKRPGNARGNYQSLNKSIDDLVFSNQKLEDRLRNGLATVRKCREDSLTKKDQLNTTIERLKIKLHQKSNMEKTREPKQRNKQSRHWRDGIQLDLSLVQNMEPSCFLKSQRTKTRVSSEITKKKDDLFRADNNVYNKIYIQNSKKAQPEYLAQCDRSTSINTINRNTSNRQDPGGAEADTSTAFYQFLTQAQKQQFNNLTGVQGKIDAALRRARKAIV